MGNAYALYSRPDIIPHPLKEPTFDSNLGFPNGRQERVMLATEEQLQSAKVPVADRDYCAHLLLDYRGCRADTWPFVYQCHHQKHAYLTCEYEDYVLRMKEYEREKRLRMRAERIANQGME